MRLNARTLVTLSAMGILLWLFFVPWRTGVEAPALMTGREHITVYSPLNAKVQSLQAEVGDRVDQGTVLAVLRSPELEYRLAQARRREGVLEWEIANAGTSGKLSTRRLVADEELRTVRFNLAGIAEEMRRLTLASPIAGTVTEAPEDLHPGQWISRTAPLFKHRSWRIDRDAPTGRRITRAGKGAYYRVILDPEADISGFPERSIRGLALISGGAQSLAERAWTTVMSVLIRESGF